IKPKFVKALKYHGDIVNKFETEVINPSICSKATLRKVKKMLEGVVENGTATNIKNKNYKIAGKTGTAQIANIESGYSDKSKLTYQASFVGYFPADNPKYSCIVVVNSPSKNIYYGNLVAGPVFKEISDKVYATRFDMHDKKLADISHDVKVPYTKHSYKHELDYVLKKLGIHVYDEKVDSDWVLTTKKDSCVKLSNRFIDHQFMPNVAGMGVKDAVFILENLGLEIEIQGRGTVLKQSITPGSKIIKGQLVVLEMSIQ
ncbi:MAG TPA: penicillin-binding transpeptidase domain-containing protein, partial [Bacteroidales bacterium]|nr:penicillin-binding transpeptidase domain-containing protein [Bacteroidales bacterium]